MDSKISSLIQQLLQKDDNIFLIGWVWVNDKKIRVTVDGLERLGVNDIYDFTKSLRNLLEENALDLALEISSPDASKPLVDIRQYPKHMGRELLIKNKSNTEFTGVLVEVNKDYILLERSERVPKEIGKGKRTIKKEEKILFDDILETKVKIKF